jgi:hypothetical protein
MERCYRFLYSNINDKDKLPDIIFLDINPRDEWLAVLNKYIMLKSKIEKSVDLYSKFFK